jgi:hypothetical protein
MSFLVGIDQGGRSHSFAAVVQEYLYYWRHGHSHHYFLVVFIIVARHVFVFCYYLINAILVFILFMPEA